MIFRWEIYFPPRLVPDYQGSLETRLDREADMQHDAFEAIRVLKRLPLQICALATWGKIVPSSVSRVSSHRYLPSGDFFLLSTVNTRNEAVLLLYSIGKSIGNCSPFHGFAKSV